MNRSFLHEHFLYRQRVFVRADLNVPIAENGSIKNDKRLRAIIPTIKHIQQKGGKVILASHIGRPSGNGLEHHLSTRNLITWLEEQGLRIDFESDLIAAHQKTYHDSGRVMLLENLRFFMGEKLYSMPFAELLANLADIFVNDAFGTMHRNDTSVALLPQLFLPQNRGWGLLVEQELHALEKLHDAPAAPLMLVLGGSKISDKIPLIKNFLHHTAPKSIILGGKIALPFLAEQGLSMGKSNPTFEEMALAKEVLEQLDQTKLLLPVDVIVATDATGSTQITPKTISDIGSNDFVIDIGPQSIELFTQELANAKTIFLNGTMGYYESPQGLQGTQDIIRAVAQTSGTKIIGGGDAVAAVEAMNLQDKMTFLSTGGGATLAYLGSENPWHNLPGLKALGPAA
jgi:phosphoglycerate kinase